MKTNVVLLAFIPWLIVPLVANAQDVRGQESEPAVPSDQAQSGDQRLDEAGRPASIPAETSAEAKDRAASTPAGETPTAGAIPSAPAITEKATREGAFLESIWPMINLSTQWFLHYRLTQESVNQGDDDKALANRFDVSRGYLTLKITPTKWFESRATLDTSQNDKGDWGVRLKYMYGKFKLPVETAVVTEPFVEFGIAHTPWFDYEEHINYYRMQGTMLIERNGIQNSADLGVIVGGLLGKKLDDDYQKTVNKEYPGTWGSFALGVYNGGGYHAPENNQNKVIEGRLSVRPLGFIHPNWQVSYYGVYGKGNLAPAPDWTTNVFLTSYEHCYFVVTGQYAFGRGNQKGDKFLDTGNDGEFNPSDDHALEFKGASAFTEVRLPMIRSSLIGRFDYWDWEGSQPLYRVISGYAFHILGERKNVVMIDYDRVFQQGKTDAWELKLTLQVMF